MDLMPTLVTLVRPSFVFPGLNLKLLEGLSSSSFQSGLPLLFLIQSLWKSNSEHPKVELFGRYSVAHYQTTFSQNDKLSGNVVDTNWVYSTLACNGVTFGVKPMLFL